MADLRVLERRARAYRRRLEELSIDYGSRFLKPESLKVVREQRRAERSRYQRMLVEVEDQLRGSR